MMSEINKYIFITRIVKSESQTIGILNYINNEDVFSLFTVERPELNNKKFISNIPVGIYKYEKWYSPTFKMNVIRLINVPDRDNILIHPANYYYQLEGCIAAGINLKDINGDGNEDVTDSRNSIKKLVSIIPDNGYVKIIEA